MDRRTFGFTLAAAAALGIAPTVTFAKAKNKDVVIVLPISVAEGKTRADHKEIMAAIKKYTAEVGKHSGLIDQRVLAGKFERPNFVHVSIWEKQSDWEALFADSAFLELLNSVANVVSLKSADMYREIAIE